MNRRISPCMLCTRVKDPAGCENKNCKVWQVWFIERWEQLRCDVRAAMDAPVEPVGVVVGGRHYAAPHQTRAYLQKDPCQGCACPKALCLAPCNLKRGWEQAREIVDN